MAKQAKAKMGRTTRTEAGLGKGARKETCACGCGAAVAVGSNFKQGHDARLKGQLLRAARGEAAAGEPHRTAGDAKRELREWGWSKFLTARKPASKRKAKSKA